MEKNRIIAIIIIVIILIGGGVWYLQSTQQPSHTPLKDIIINPSPTSASALLLVAKDQGYFAQHGLNVTFISTPSGSVSMQELLNHKIDFVLVNEYSLSEPLLYNKSLKASSTLSESDTIYMVNRRDRGIIQVTDLEGKKIGVSKGSIGEYFLDRFFVLNGLSLSNATIINLDPASLVNAIVKGDIDAAVSFEPYVYQMRQQIGENAAVWPINLGQHAHFSLICNERTVQEHPEIVEEVLSSLLEAETYTNSHPKEAKKIVQTLTKFDDQYLEQEWQNHLFSVTLSQSLIKSMEDETRWRIRNNLTDAVDIPDFSKYIAADTLYKLKPSAVTIIQ